MGYSSRAHAFAVFKKTTGLTPTRFWKRLHQPAGESIHSDCILSHCPLLGAVLDRYKRNHRRMEYEDRTSKNQVMYQEA